MNENKTQQGLSLIRLIFYVVVLLISIACTCRQKGSRATWPEISRETKPWTRWWWQGSAVNPAGLTANMEELGKAGFGGVEITPIYGVKGYEDQFIDFLSPDWMSVFEHTLKEGRRLDLGVDLANASGWPFGGPWVEEENACKNVYFKQYSLKEGGSLKEKVILIQEPLVRAVGHRPDISGIRFPVSSNPNLQELALDQVRFEKPLPLQTLMAYSDKGDVLELTGRVGADGTLDWQAPAGNWKLYAVFRGWHGKQVERAGPGGEGNVIDHFSEKATKEFLNVFDEKAKGKTISGLRAFFNDSYEVDDAFGESDWTPLFFDEFSQRRGYDLKRYLPALFGDDSEEMNNRALCDFRETISDLLLDRFTKVWAAWAKTHQSVIRNQAHGSPANILDLYAAGDIPETEGTEVMRIKMATSAGHVSGKPLIACEAATWLNEHFRATLSEVKQNLDRYLANGVNHIVYHGTPYSPLSEEWPGWMFYASVHFAPSNTWWSDLKTLNEYVANCQSFMQRSIPANDVLVYFPIYDSWSAKGRSRLVHFGGAGEELTKELSEILIAKGFTFDYISDRQIMQLTASQNRIRTKGGIYRTILVPACKYMPLGTMQKLISLIESGVTVIFQDQLPGDVPGLANLEKRQQAFGSLVRSIDFKKVGDVSVFSKGKGQLLMGNDVEDMLSLLDIFPEEMAQLGLWFNRVKRVEGTCYLISNWSEQKIGQWVTIQSPERQAVWFDPMQRRMGKARIQRLDERRSRVYLQLDPGETLILQCYPYQVDLPDYPLWQGSGIKTALEGEWTISFTKGGPALPASFKTAELKSWTEQSDELKKFSGTASYRISFDRPATEAQAWELDLGRVCESAEVSLNGEKLGTLLGPDWTLIIEATRLKDTNELEILVTNLMANRIIDMDRSGVNYRKFYNINFPARKRENVGSDGLFTAASWEPLESGLLGPVTLSPLSPL
ncbi:MAG: glycosyl hydrolase [Mangrovibacterium sp.]